MAERVLITGARAAAALDIGRDFARAGYEVHMADCVITRLSAWSRFITRVHRYPSPVLDPAGFHCAIKRLGEQLKPALIVPTCEEVFHLAEVPVAELFQPSAGALRGLHDKGLFADQARGLGLPSPETHRLEGRDDLAPLLNQSHDWVFKARFSRFGQGTLVGPSPERLAAIDPRGWIAQRRVAGREVSFYAVARAGVVTAFAAYGSAWRLEGGASLSFDPVEPALAEAMLAQARVLAAALELTGQFACDAMVDDGGTPWLIECNPRATSGAHLLAGDGRLARAMLETPDQPVVPTGERRHLLPALATFGLGLALRQGTLAAWLEQVRLGRDVAGQPGDRAPMLGAVIDGLAFMAAGVRMGISTTAATTADIEWNGAS